jgi:hypothetical protein
MRAVASRLAVSTRRPSLLKETPATQPRCGTVVAITFVTESARLSTFSASAVRFWSIAWRASRTLSSGSFSSWPAAAVASSRERAVRALSTASFAGSRRGRPGRR